MRNFLNERNYNRKKNKKMLGTVCEIYYNEKTKNTHAGGCVNTVTEERS